MADTRGTVNSTTMPRKTTRATTKTMVTANPLDMPRRWNRWTAGDSRMAMKKATRV